MSRPAGLVLIVAGAALVVVGLLVLSGGFSWFGRIPGDIRIEKENVLFYFPVVLMLLVSLALTLILSILRRLF